MRRLGMVAESIAAGAATETSITMRMFECFLLAWKSVNRQFA